MAPLTILNKLAQVRRRERLLRCVWGVARVLAVSLALLAFCCFADWLIDRWYDTPRELLQAFLLLQGLVVAGLAIVFVAIPALKPLSDSTLAVWVERAFPAFRHRLITAVELNRSQATIEGMSPSLIAAVTKEAEQKASATDFGPAVDSRRLTWSAAVLGPVLLLVLLPAVLSPRTVGELLARQLLRPVEITRSVRFHLQDIATLPADNTIDRDEPHSPHQDLHQPAICASGDRVAIRFHVEGANKITHGTLRVRPEGGPVEDHELAWESDTPDGSAIFAALVPASSVDFAYKAWLGDARMRQEGKVEFRARPTVENQRVVVLLPEYCGLRPDGTRFEEKTETKGEVLGLSGSTAQVTVIASTQLKRGLLELLGPSQAGAPDQVLASKEMALGADGKSATGRFDLDPRQTSYRIVIWDTFGFANRVIPRRGVALQPDEAPLVTLLPERFAPETVRVAGGITEDNEVEGLPVLLGEGIRIAYRAKSLAGLQSARLRYRVNEERDFAILPLRESLASAGSGPFELERGVFKNIREDDDKAQVEFHAVEESPDRRDLSPSRREGGGRFDFQTAKIPGLKVGDKIEFYMEVLDNRSGHLVGRSEARVKDVVSLKQLLAWIQAKRQEDEKLRDLEKRQGGLFDAAAPK